MTSDEDNNSSESNTSLVYEVTANELLEFSELEPEDDDESKGTAPKGRGRADVDRCPKIFDCAMDITVWTDCDSFEPDVCVFDHNNKGIKNDFPCPKVSPEMDYFCTFFNQDMCQFICDETNDLSQFM